jgi:uncharacterized protein with ParB-like and HNH nuclease domain
MNGLTYEHTINHNEQWWEDDIGSNDEDIKIYDLITYPSDFTISTIFEKLTNGNISIPPFQRNYVWDIKQASKLIESLIIGLPVPQIFLFEEENKSLIIDGQQRLLSIFYFIKGRIPKQNKRAALRKKIIEIGSIDEELLSDDEFFTDFKLKLFGTNKLNGLSYESLDTFQEKFKSRPVRVMHIKQLAPDEKDRESSMYEIFDRLNTGGTNLSEQEIRMNIYYSNFYKMIDEINILPKWRQILGKDELDLRFKDFEILVRVFALAENFQNYKSVMKTFLNDFSYEAKQFTNDKNRYLKQSFLTFLDCYEITEKKTKFHIGVFDSIFYIWYQEYKKGNILSLTDEKIENIKEEIARYQKQNRSTTYKDSVEARFEIAKKWIV